MFMTLMKSFLMPFVAFKKHLVLSNILDVLPTMLPNNPQFENIKNKNTFDPSACSVSYVYLVPLVSFDIVYKAFNLQPLCAPYCAQRKFLCSTQCPWCLLCAFFTHLLNCLVPLCHFLSKFLSLCCSSSFIILDIVWVCFCCY